VLAFAPQASAQDIGWYAAFDLGYHWPEDMEVESVFLGESADVELDSNVAGFGRFGYQFSPNLRSELELGSRPSDFAEEGVSGNVKLTTAMVNVIYDFVPDSSFTPFLGVGGGAARVEVEAAQPVGGFIDVEDDDTAFAWQGIGGLAF